MSKRISGLYAVSPDLADSISLVGKIDSALRGGARMVQYRSKSAEVALCRAQARELARLCRDWNALFIVNDNADLAHEVDADGVHLGKNDLSVAAARAVLGSRKLIGVSCYDEIARARSAVSEGADYVAFGSFFPSSTKPHATRASADLLRIASTEIGVPIVAIGGIRVDNAANLISAGADALAVVGALFDAPDIEKQARRFARLFEDPDIAEVKREIRK